MNGLTLLERERLRVVIRKVVINSKGMDYLVLDIAKKYTTDEVLVICLQLYGNNEVYVIPAKIFLSTFRLKEKINTGRC